MHIRIFSVLAFALFLFNDPCLAAGKKAKIPYDNDAALAGSLSAYPENDASKPCDKKLEVSSINISSLGEHKITSIESLFRTGASTCAGIVNLEFQNDYVDEDTAAQHPDSAKMDVPFLVSTDGKKVQVVDSLNKQNNSLYRCGPIKLSFLNSESGGRALRMASEFGYCHGGSAREAYDSVFSIAEDGSLELLSESFKIYH